MRSERALSLLARSLVAGIFIGAGISKLRHEEGNLAYMASKGLPKRPSLLRAAAMAETGLGPAFLSGLRSEYSAALLALYLIPTTLIFHDFWNQKDQERENQKIHFMKNLAIIGALLQSAVHERELHRAIEKPSEEVAKVPPSEPVRHAA